MLQAQVGELTFRRERNGDVVIFHGLFPQARSTMTREAWHGVIAQLYESRAPGQDGLDEYLSNSEA